MIHLKCALVERYVIRYDDGTFADLQLQQLFNRRVQLLRVNVVHDIEHVLAGVIEARDMCRTSGTAHSCPNEVFVLFGQAVQGSVYESIAYNRHVLFDFECELLIGQFEFEKFVFELFHIEQHNVEWVISRVVSYEVEIKHDAFTERRVIEWTGRNKHVLIGVTDKRA